MDKKGSSNGYMIIILGGQRNHLIKLCKLSQKNFQFHVIGIGEETKSKHVSDLPNFIVNIEQGE